MKSLKRILIVDDHKVFRMGLVELIKNDGHFKVVGEAGDGETALKAIINLKPDIAVLDISMPKMNGLEVSRAAQKSAPGTAIIILSMHKDVNYLDEALSTGVKGYILKNNSSEEIIDSLVAVSAGNHYITPELFGLLAEQRKAREDLLERTPRIKQLTATERKVLKLISQRKTSKEIAAELFISYRTVQKHRANICTKLNLRGWNALQVFALETASNL